MIILWLTSILYVIVVQFLGSILPVADIEITAKFNSIFAFMFDNFRTIGFYYLPVQAMYFALKTIIGVYLISLTIKLIMKLAHIFTGGLIKTDKL